jgi:hypothetical protein
MADIAQIAERNAHIPDAEIEQDILDTEREITQMELEAERLAETPLSMPDARLQHMRADSRRSGIAERKKFVADLKAILDYRRGRG